MLPQMFMPYGKDVQIDFIWEKIDVILPRSVFVETIVFPSKENVIFPCGSLGMWKLLRMG